MKNLTTTHFKAVERILYYLKGTITFGFFYSLANDYKLIGYGDCDWTRNVDD